MKSSDKESIINQLDTIDDIGELSDGYHTYNSLYYQRLILFATIVNQNPDISWKSLRHEDGELCFGGGWFIVGIDTPEGSYTYHYETKDFDLFKCTTLELGKHWDGHTDKDVTRLLSLQNHLNSENSNTGLINREALKNILSEPLYRSTIKDYGEILPYTFVMTVINNAPLIPLPDFKAGYEQAIIDGKANFSKPQGEWINHRNDCGHNIADCSCCGKAMQWHDEDEDGIPRFCWYCGADMRGSEE